MKKQIVSIAHIDTELGQMVAAATDSGICMLEYADSKHLEAELKQISNHFKAELRETDNEHLAELRLQLRQYFNLERREFDVPIDLVGTEFQKTVWMSLLKIPYGSTISYATQATLIGKPSAVRAVANANGKNKVSIILPCHRVIGTNGKLTGYGGGVWRKEMLLELEKKTIGIPPLVK